MMDGSCDSAEWMIAGSPSHVSETLTKSSFFVRRI